MAANIEERHARKCPRSTSTRGRCNCEPSYRAKIRVGDKRVPYSSRSYAEVEAWLADAKIAKKRNHAVAGKTVDTLQTVVDAWLEAARKGVIRKKGGELYAPASIRDYEQTLRIQILPTLGNEPVTDIRRADLQDLIDEMVADGVPSSTVQKPITALKAILRRELSRGRIQVSPADRLDLPAIRNKRPEIRSPAEIERLLAAVPVEDRTVWATAAYAGLRRGELMALRVDRIDLTANVIHVEAGWDAIEGEKGTKSGKARTVPILDQLRKDLVAHLMRTGRRDRDLVFGRTATAPFNPRQLMERADTAWKDAGLKRITLHNCRHVFASVMIAAGVNGKALQSYMGHASITTTFDTYGHLMPGSEAEAAALTNAYLAKALGAGA